ncbi:MAG: family 43 glycosylhydrolase [Verrucomicrobiota bacterium]
MNQRNDNRQVPAIAFTLLLTSLVAGAEWKPAPDSMLTEWGEALRPETAWKEYPRPALERGNWSNLNGLWNYAITPTSVQKAPGDWDGEILVPFPIESALSGVKKRITPDDAIWYRRTFKNDAKSSERTLLNFEAVDYSCTIWANDTKVGSHTGGNLPFSFDISEALKAGENSLTVRVTDATDTAYQLHGKQVTEPKGIWYTPVSGIWQTVWLERVPAVHVTGMKITPANSGRVAIELTTNRDVVDGKATVTASLKGEQVATTTGPVGSVTLNIPDPQLWSPESPTLYDLEIKMGDDVLRSYTGLRETTLVKDKNGHMRFALNGKTYFHWGTLDQGWWPDGLLTPPSDAAMRSDIEFLKAAGFNTVRKHIKVESRRYYTHCDRLGILVYQDQVSSGTGKKRGTGNSSAAWTRLKPDPVDAKWPDAAHEQFMDELEIMIDTLHNHPSIVQWVPFNEAWGQHRTMKVGEWSVKKDPTRQINVASGGNFYPVGHVADHHQYPHPDFPFELGEGGRFDEFVKVVGEFGGHGFPVKGHLWDPKARNWGYGGLPKNKEEWIERYKTSLKLLANLKGMGVAGGIYTQTTDVEGEINGLITYDRKVQKIDPAVLKTLADKLLAAPDHVVNKTILPTAERAGKVWRYTTKAPAKDWSAPGFDDSSWKEGSAGFGTKTTPRTHVRTIWNTKAIWIRRSFEVPAKVEGSLSLRVYHDEGADVFLNGKKVASLTSFNGRYTNVSLPEDALQVGRNVLAIHCRQTTGGQYIDAGLVLSSAEKRAVAAPPKKQGKLTIPDAQVGPVAPVMSRTEIEAGLKSHDRALFIHNGWIRDPYITLGPDDHYYLTGTTINDEDPREKSDPYNIGLSSHSAVGTTVRVWKSKDLIDWKSLGSIFQLEDGPHGAGKHLWAPEVHWIPEMKRWALVHCPKRHSNLLLSAGSELKGPWSSPLGTGFKGHHDPSLYKVGNDWWVLSENTNVRRLSSDFTKLIGERVRIDPSGSRPRPGTARKLMSTIGHEGATMMKVGDKFVHLGTAWSTDRGRKGSYNLYYCTADKITGPYGPRKFAGRFLGHGTPFQTRDGKWWCTAFFNSNVLPVKREGIQTRDLSETAQTINQRGTTIVPLDVRTLDSGEVYIRAKDPDYANPGPDEAQKKFQ